MTQPILQAGRGVDLHRLSSQVWVLGCALAAVSAVTVVATLTTILDPDIRPLLLQEDGIIEMASAIFLLMVVFGSFVSIVTWGLRLPFLLAGLVGFAELMDETSFGSRLFGFEPPPLYGGGQLDGFHDLLIVAYRLLGNLNSGLAWLWVGLLLAGSIGALSFALYQAAKSFHGRTTWVFGHCLIFLHFGFIGMAQVIDAATSSHILSAIEEVFELNAAILLAFYVAQQALPEPTATNSA